MSHSTTHKLNKTDVLEVGTFSAYKQDVMKFLYMSKLKMAAVIVTLILIVIFMSSCCDAKQGCGTGCAKPCCASTQNR